MAPWVESDFFFTVGRHQLAATQILVNSQPPQALLIHGAGPGNRQRFKHRANWLAQQGISSLRFDHAGHGESEGSLADSSLQQRIEEAVAALAFCADAPLIVMGSSMGAHIAANLLAHTQISYLILVVPAAYSATASTLKFNGGFTEAIRQPENWLAAPQWPLLEQYKGKLLLVTGGRDEVIPQDIVRYYWNNAPQAQRWHFYHPQAPHAFFPWLEKEAETVIFERTMAEFLIG